MSFKSHYLSPTQAARAGAALRAAGYAVTDHQCREYVLNVAALVDPYHPDHATAIIEAAVCGAASDREGYAIAPERSHVR